MKHWEDSRRNRRATEILRWIIKWVCGSQAQLLIIYPKTWEAGGGRDWICVCSCSPATAHLPVFVWKEQISKIRLVLYEELESLRGLISGCHLLPSSVAYTFFIVVNLMLCSSLTLWENIHSKPLEHSGSGVLDMHPVIGNWVKVISISMVWTL